MMNKAVMGVIIGLLSLSVGADRVRAQSCYTEQQVAQSCTLYSECWYIFNNQVYKMGTCGSPHQGHACGSKFNSLPTLHNTLINTVFPGLKRGDVCVIPVVGSSDLNADGEINIFDYGILLRDYAKTGLVGFIPADIVKTGGVDFVDLSELLSKIN